MADLKGRGIGNIAHLRLDNPLEVSSHIRRGRCSMPSPSSKSRDALAASGILGRYSHRIIITFSMADLGSSSKVTALDPTLEGSHGCLDGPIAVVAFAYLVVSSVRARL